MKADSLANGSTVKNHISLKTVFEYSATRRTSFRSFFLVCQRVLSSSSSISPTMSDSETRGRADLCGIDSYPVSVSSEHVERKERRDPFTKPTKNPKPNKNEDHDLERGDPLYSDIPE